MKYFIFCRSRGYYVGLNAKGSHSFLRSVTKINPKVKRFASQQEAFDVIKLMDPSTRNRCHPMEMP